MTSPALALAPAPLALLMAEVAPAAEDSLRQAPAGTPIFLPETGPSSPAAGLMPLLTLAAIVAALIFAALSVRRYLNSKK